MTCCQLGDRRAASHAGGPYRHSLCEPEHASGLLFPSYAEGFGIPIVEGALFGLPVICSDIEVFREITADMATDFDPADSGALAGKVIEVLDNKAQKLELAQKLRHSVTTRFSQATMMSRLRQLLESRDTAD